MCTLHWEAALGQHAPNDRCTHIHATHDLPTGTWHVSPHRGGMARPSSTEPPRAAISASRYLQFRTWPPARSPPPKHPPPTPSRVSLLRAQVLTRCRECFGPQIDVYFKAPVFLKFERDGNGCISANQFLNYLNLRTTMHQNVRMRVRNRGGFTTHPRAPPCTRTYVLWHALCLGALCGICLTGEQEGW